LLHLIFLTCARIAAPHLFDMRKNCCTSVVDISYHTTHKTPHKIPHNTVHLSVWTSHTTHKIPHNTTAASSGMYDGEVIEVISAYKESGVCESLLYDKLTHTKDVTHTYTHTHTHTHTHTNTHTHTHTRTLISADTVSHHHHAACMCDGKLKQVELANKE